MTSDHLEEVILVKALKGIGSSLLGFILYAYNSVEMTEQE